MREFIMRDLRTSALVALFLAALATQPACAQLANLPRTELQRHDLSAPNLEVVQARIDFPPGAFGARHSHPGEEIIYVIEGTIEYQIDGQPPTRVSAGEVLFVPAGAIHSARNVGDDAASELATYVVEKGRPLIVAAR
jgi:quercetin dioxygenase-like cupin family protein